MKKIKLYTKNRSMDEIYQAVQMQFAFAVPTEDEDVFEQSHQLVLCRDFLHDALRAHLLKTRAAIYGFVFEGETQQIYDNKTFMLVKLPKIAEHTDIIKKILHLFEKKMRIKRTVIHETDQPDMILLESSKVWMSSSQMISLYTFLPRIAVNEDKAVRAAITGSNNLRELLNKWRENKNIFSTHERKDVRYLVSLSKYLDIVITHRRKLGLDQETTLKANIKETLVSFHNCSGIVSLCCDRINRRYTVTANLQKRLQKLAQEKSKVATK